MADRASDINPKEHRQPQMPQSSRMAHDSIIDLLKKNSAEEAEHLNSRSKQIPRFPSNLQRIGRERDHIIPRTVAIGPYYHGEPKLQPMEEVKCTAANYFFEGLAEQRDAIYEKIKSIARDARRCYTDKDAIQDITDDKFAEIMFIDGCFLVQFIEENSDASLISIINPHFNCVLRDIMLLENQIPWKVMEVLMPLKSLTMEDISINLARFLHGALLSKKTTEPFARKDYNPGHLLCLIRCFEADSKQVTTPSFCGDVLPMYTSAAELTEMGIKLEVSQNTKISAMDLVQGPLCAKLPLAPLNLDDDICCWLVNMAACEMWAETSRDHDRSVNSYLSVLSLLMNREEDVRELRAKGILRGPSSDRKTIEFFNDLAPNLKEGDAYWRLIKGLAEYRQKRRVWISIYRFLYKNAKTIVAVLSIIAMLVGIFKALYSLKQ